MRALAVLGALLTMAFFLPGQSNAQEKTTRKHWFHHTRLSAMPGYDYFGHPMVGLSLVHATGMRIGRHLGAGLTIGLEHYEPFNGAIGIYPVMAEVRTWMDASRRAEPFAVLNLGYGWPTIPAAWGQAFDYKGGIGGRALLGYRLGKHLSLQGGLSIQRWQRSWAFQGVAARDTTTYKRLVLGFGVLF